MTFSETQGVVEPGGKEVGSQYEEAGVREEVMDGVYERMADYAVLEKK